jgi:hypothetical protein
MQQSVITGITTLFSYGLDTGGPAGMFQWPPLVEIRSGVDCHPPK